MFFEILLIILLGIVFGVITGLIPGIHINLVSVVLVSASVFLLEYVSLASLVAFILAMSITHTFTDFISSVYLGVPEAETALAVLPGHQLLLEGKAYEAVRLTTVGSLLCLILIVVCFPLLLFIVPLIFDLVRPWIGVILLAIVVFMILKESTVSKKVWSFIVFLSSGVLGVIVLNMNTVEQPLFHLLSGIFGVSMLITSLSSKTTLPPQKVTEDIQPSKKELTTSVFGGFVSGSFVTIFPGLGPAQAAILASQFFKHMTNVMYLIMVGGINTVSMAMSLITLFTIDKARNGSIVAVQQLLDTFTFTHLLFAVGVVLITAGIATFVTLFIGKGFSHVMNKINYTYLSVGIIGLIYGLSLYFSSWIGIIVLTVSAAIGIIPVVKNVGRNHAMGVLLLPVMLYFLL